MKIILILITVFCVVNIYPQKKHNTIEAYCELLSPGVGRAIKIATYKVINVLNGIPSNDTITVGFYSNTLKGNLPKYSVIKVDKYVGNRTFIDYYTFPDYDINLGFPFFLNQLDSISADENFILTNKIIPNKDGAIRIVEPILFSTYGKNNIIKQQPYDVIEINDYWIIRGRLAKGIEGKSFFIIINSFDGKVVRLTYK